MIYPLVTNPFDESDISVIIDSFKSGQYTMGPKVRDFEKAFADKVGSRYAVMVNSGSSANLIATFAFFYKQKNSLRRGDEVLVPAIGWATTWSPLQQAGLQLKVIDVDPRTLNVDFDSYITAVTEKTKMIVTVSILGNPVELDRLRKFCTEKEIILLEDNCESIGASVGGKQCGTFGDIGTYSFFYSHHISTVEGGIAVTDDEELYHILLSLRAHGWVRDIPNNKFVSEKLESEIRQQYNFVFPGFNVRPMEFSGALGLAQLKKLDNNVKIRRKNASQFQKIMQKHSELFSFQEEVYGESSWFAFPIVIKNGSAALRDKLFLHLADRGIESRMITGGCLTRHPMKRYFDFVTYPVPVEAEKIHDGGVFVANHAVDMTLMFGALDEALASFKE
jgi:CDP-6-deoxy-D-xylo-4-hexulose-3-dehydrase